MPRNSVYYDISDNSKSNQVKACPIGHIVMVSLRCASLSTNTRFRFLYFKMNNCLNRIHLKAYTMINQVIELPNDSGRPFSYNNFTDKKTKRLCY